MSRPMPFVPMGPQAPLATPEDHARMAAVLAKHAKPKVAVSPGVPRCPDASRADPTPSALTRADPLLEWGKPYNIGPGTAMLKSLCGLFRIDRVTSQLSVGYTSWSLAPAGQGLNRRLGCAETADAAKALCEAAR